MCVDQRLQAGFRVPIITLSAWLPRLSAEGKHPHFSEASVHLSAISTRTARVSFFLRRGPGLAPISSLPFAPPTTMLASPSTLERARSSRHGSRAPMRHAQSSPLSHGHSVGAVISPLTDTLLQDHQPRLTRPRRKGLSWNISWRTHRSSTLFCRPHSARRRDRESRRQPTHVVEDTFASRLEDRIL